MTQRVDLGCGAYVTDYGKCALIKKTKKEKKKKKKKKKKRDQPPLGGDWRASDPTYTMSQHLHGPMFCDLLWFNQ